MKKLKFQKSQRKGVMQQAKKKIIISGGGSGGHIFPAIAIANALQSKMADVDILFIGAKDKMEMDKVPKAGYPIEGLWISGLQRSLSPRNLSFPFKLISSLRKAGKIIKELDESGKFKKPVGNLFLRWGCPAITMSSD